MLVFRAAIKLLGCRKISGPGPVSLQKVVTHVLHSGADTLQQGVFSGPGARKLGVSVEPHRGVRTGQLRS